MAHRKTHSRQPHRKYITVVEVPDIPPENKLTADDIFGPSLDRSQARHVSKATALAQSGFRGVYLKKNGRFAAEITYQGRKQYLGTYDTPEEAAREYDTWAQRIYGDIARLNFPPNKT